MRRIKLDAIALAIGFACSAGSWAQALSGSDYTTGKDKIAADYKAAKAACALLSGNAKDICVAQAEGDEKVARAELDARRTPTPKMHYEALAAKADADYKVASEKCDDLAGNAKDVCVKEAKATRTTAKADAKAQMKSAEANATAGEKTADARTQGLRTRPA